MPINAQFNSSILNPLFQQRDGGPLESMYKVQQLIAARDHNQLFQQKQAAAGKISQFVQANTPEGGRVDLGGVFADLISDRETAPFAAELYTPIAQADTAQGQAIAQRLQIEQTKNQMFGDVLAPLLDNPEITNADAIDAVSTLFAQFDAAGVPYDEEELFSKVINLPSDQAQRRQVIGDFAQRSMTAAENIKTTLPQLATVNDRLVGVTTPVGGAPTAEVLGDFSDQNVAGFEGMTATQQGRYFMLYDALINSGMAPEEADRRAKLEVGSGIYAGNNTQTGEFQLKTLAGEVLPTIEGMPSNELVGDQAELPGQLSSDDTLFVSSMMPAYKDYIQAQSNVTNDLLRRYNNDPAAIPAEDRGQLALMRQDFMDSNGLSTDDMRMLESQALMAERREQEVGMTEAEEQERIALDPAYARAFGLSGTISRLLNKAGGLASFGTATPDPDVQRVQNELRSRSAATRDFWRSLAQGRELAAFESRLTSLDINPDNVFQAPSDARDKIDAMLSLMDEMTIENSRLSESLPVGSSTRQDAEATLIRMQNDIEYWNGVRDQLNEAAVPNPEASGAARFDAHPRRRIRREQ